MKNLNDLTFSSKHCKLTTFVFDGKGEHKTLTDFDWYFEKFSEFLKTKNILVFKNNSLNIEMTFISDFELNDDFMKKLLHPLFHFNNIKNQDEYLKYINIHWLEAHLDNKLKPTSVTKKPKI